jgi:hypothetical protein
MSPTRRRSSLAAVGLGSVAGAAVVGGAATLVHHWVVAGEPSDIGPTAATFDDFFGTFLLGIVPSLFAASLVAGLLAHSPLVAYGSAVGAALILCAVGSAASFVDWPAVVGLVFAAAVIGALAAAAAALPVVLRGGTR